MANRAAYWSGHLEAIEAEGIATSAYAQREGLAVGSLYEWRRRLKSEQRRPAQRQRSTGFIAVQVRPVSESVRCTLTIGEGTALEFSQLPSPQWVAALCIAVGGGGR
jgi:hypothetical protein